MSVVCKTETSAVLPDPGGGGRIKEEEEKGFAVKEEVGEKWISKEEEVDEAIWNSLLPNPPQPSLPEPPQMKEEQELWTNQQLQWLQSDDTTASIFTSDGVKPASDFQPRSVTPHCPTAQSSDGERGGLMPGLLPELTACCSSLLLSASLPSTKSSAGSSFKTKTSPWTRAIPSSHSGTNSEDVSSGEAERKRAKKQHQDVQQLSLPELPQIKEEQELWTSQGGEQLKLPPLYQGPAVENRERDYLSSNTTEEQIKMEYAQEDYGAPELYSDSQPTSVTPDCPTAQSLDGKGGRLMSELLPELTACCHSLLLIASLPVTKSSTGSGLRSKTSLRTRASPSSHSGTNSDVVSSGKAERRIAKKQHQDVQQRSLPERPQIREEQEPCTNRKRQPLQGLQSDTTASIKSSTASCFKTKTSPWTRPIPSSHSGPNSEDVSSGEAERKGAKKQHYCGICDKVFNNKLESVNHRRSHKSDVMHKVPTGEKPYECEQCGIDLKRKRYLIEHIRIHTGEKPFKCKECGNAFRTHIMLNNHIRVHTGERRHQCQECGKAFGTKHCLDEHRRSHTGEKPYQCEECGKPFNNKNNLLLHRRTHTGEKPYQCEHCDKPFSTRPALVAHKRIHTGEKPYQCEHCDKCFSQQGSLVQHRRIHTGEKPHKCEECGKAFIQKNGLISHRRIHQGEG